MPVTTLHESYRDPVLMRQSARGQEAIKGAGTLYLPEPGGNAALRLEDKALADAIYAAYKLRATYTALVTPSIEGLVGMAHRVPWTVEVPSRLNYLMDEATPDGASMDELAEYITREVLTTGGLGLVADYEGRDARLIPYCSESLVNWHTERRGVTRVVLKEDVSTPSIADRFVLEKRVGYRVLEIVDGQYMATEYEPRDKTGLDGSAFTERDITPDYQEGRIPFAFAGSQSTRLGEAQAIPLEPMVDHLLTAYRISADWRQSLHMVAQPTPYVFGTSEAPSLLGSSAVLWSKEPTAQAGYMEVSGNGLSSLEAAHDAQILAALMHSHHLAERGKQVESGDALAARTASKTASLRSVVINGAHALAQILRHAALMVGADADQVRVVPNLDFVASSADAALARVYGEQAALGVIPREVYWAYLRDTGVTKLTDQEFAEMSAADQDRLDAETSGFGNDGIGAEQEGQGERMTEEDLTAELAAEFARLRAAEAA